MALWRRGTPVTPRDGTSQTAKEISFRKRAGF